MKKLLLFAVALMTLCAVKAQDESSSKPILASGKGEWKQNCKEFPKGSVVTKVRLKNNGGSGGSWKEVRLEGMNSSTYLINAKKLFIEEYKPYKANKVTFKEMDQDTDGWRVYTLPEPAVYNWSKDSSYDELCYTNIQFFVDEELTAAENVWVSSSEIEEGAIIAKVRINPQSSYYQGFKAVMFDSEDTLAEIVYGKSSYVLKDNGLATEKKFGKWKVYTFKKPVKLSLVYQSSTNVQFIIDNDAKFVYNPLFKITTDKEPAITGPDGTTMHHTTYEHKGGIRDNSYYILDVSGYLSGDRLYEKKEDGSLRLIRQIVDNLPLPVIEGDSVTGVRVEKSDYAPLYDLRFYITYASGDSLAFDSNPNSNFRCSGRLHRNGAVWTMEKGREKKIEYDNGDVYTGNFYAYRPWEELKNISNHDAWKVSYLDGTLQKKNGASITYRNGKSQMEIEAERKAEERAYRDLCNKYGKKYVDAANEADIIPGMPVELMLSIRWYTFEVCYSTNQVKVYRIRGLGVRGNTFTDKAVQGYAWVSNGRVTKITSYPPM